MWLNYASLQVRITWIVRGIKRKQLRLLKVDQRHDLWDYKKEFIYLNHYLKLRKFQRLKLILYDLKMYVASRNDFIVGYYKIACVTYPMFFFYDLTNYFYVKTFSLKAFIQLEDYLIYKYEYFLKKKYALLLLYNTQLDFEKNYIYFFLILYLKFFYYNDLLLLYFDMFLYNYEKIFYKYKKFEYYLKCFFLNTSIYSTRLKILKEDSIRVEINCYYVKGKRFEKEKGTLINTILLKHATFASIFLFWYLDTFDTDIFMHRFFYYLYYKYKWFIELKNYIHIKKNILLKQEFFFKWYYDLCQSSKINIYSKLNTFWKKNILLVDYYNFLKLKSIINSRRKKKKNFMPSFMHRLNLNNFNSSQKREFYVFFELFFLNILQEYFFISDKKSYFLSLKKPLKNFFLKKSKKGKKLLFLLRLLYICYFKLLYDFKIKIDKKKNFFFFFFYFYFYKIKYKYKYFLNDYFSIEKLEKKFIKLKKVILLKYFNKLELDLEHSLFVFFLKIFSKYFEFILDNSLSYRFSLLNQELFFHYKNNFSIFNKYKFINWDNNEKILLKLLNYDFFVKNKFLLKKLYFLYILYSFDIWTLDEYAKFASFANLYIKNLFYLNNRKFYNKLVKKHKKLYKLKLKNILILFKSRFIYKFNIYLCLKTYLFLEKNRKFVLYKSLIKICSYLQKKKKNFFAFTTLNSYFNYLYKKRFIIFHRKVKIILYIFLFIFLLKNYKKLKKNSLIYKKNKNLNLFYKKKSNKWKNKMKKKFYQFKFISKNSLKKKFYINFYLKSIKNFYPFIEKKKTLFNYFFMQLSLFFKLNVLFFFNELLFNNYIYNESYHDIKFFNNIWMYLQKKKKKKYFKFKIKKKFIFLLNVLNYFYLINYIYLNLDWFFLQNYFNFERWKIFFNKTRFFINEFDLQNRIFDKSYADLNLNIFSIFKVPYIPSYWSINHLIYGILFFFNVFELFINDHCYFILEKYKRSSFFLSKYDRSIYYFNYVLKHNTMLLKLFFCKFFFKKDKFQNLHLLKDIIFAKGKHFNLPIIKNNLYLNKFFKKDNLFLHSVFFNYFSLFSFIYCKKCYRITISSSLVNVIIYYQNLYNLDKKNKNILKFTFKKCKKKLCNCFLVQLYNKDIPILEHSKDLLLYYLKKNTQLSGFFFHGIYKKGYWNAIWTEKSKNPYFRLYFYQRIGFSIYVQEIISINLYTPFYKFFFFYCYVKNFDKFFLKNLGIDWMNTNWKITVFLVCYMKIDFFRMHAIDFYFYQPSFWHKFIFYIRNRITSADAVNWLCQLYRNEYTLKYKIGSRIARVIKKEMVKTYLGLFKDGIDNPLLDKDIYPFTFTPNVRNHERWVGDKYKSERELYNQRIIKSYDPTFYKFDHLRYSDNIKRIIRKYGYDKEIRDARKFVASLPRLYI